MDVKSARRAGGHGAVVALSFLLWGVPLEWAARHWTQRHGDSLDKSMAVLRMDAELGWRQREDFHGKFLGLPLDTDGMGLRNPVASLSEKPSSILVLGPSSTFGWGVEEDQTYSRRLEELLKGRSPGERRRPAMRGHVRPAQRGGEPVRVLNAGQIGFSSWQGLRFYQRHLRRLKSDVVVIAYGVNDVDRHRFFLDSGLPDGSALGQGAPRWSVALQNAVGRLRLIGLARRKAQALLAGLACRLGPKAPSLQGVVPGLRVPPRDFAAHLGELVRLAREDGSRVILLTSGFMLPGYPKIGAEKGRRGRDLASAGLRHMEGGRCASAIEAFERSLEFDPYQCETRYALSACYRQTGKCRDARRAFEAARRMEPFRIKRDLRSYNSLVRSIARKHGAGLVDVEALLGGKNLKALFLDPIHPTPEGHRKIAQALLKEILDRSFLGEELSAWKKGPKRPA